MDEDFINSDTVIIHNDINECYFDDSHSDIDMDEVQDTQTTNSMSMSNSYSLVYKGCIYNMKRYSIMNYIILIYL